MLTFAVYLAAAIISPAIPDLMSYFGVSDVLATLTLAMYVIAYGLGKYAPVPKNVTNFDLLAMLGPLIFSVSSIVSPNVYM